MSLARARATAGTLLTRRAVLWTGAAAGAGAVLSACGGGGATTGTTTGATGSATSGMSEPSASTGSSEPAPSSQSSGTTGPGTTVTAIDDGVRTTLDGLFDRALVDTGVVGMAASVDIGAQRWERSGGLADLRSGAAFDPAGHVRIASITKTFAATAVLRLVDQGALGLDDVLSRWIPDIPNGDRATVRMMLGMRSGIPDFTADEQFQAMFDADPTMPWSDAQTLEVIRRHPADFEPDAKVAYADSNYALLGMIIEQVTGTPAGQVITEQVLADLSLPDTSYPTDASIPDPHPTGHVPVDPVPGQAFDNAARPPMVVDEVNPAVASTAGAMIGSLADLRVWGRELTEGTLLTSALQQERLGAIRRFDGQQVNFGYGLGIIGLNEFLGHDGAIFGFSTVVLRRPQTDTTIAIVANESTNSTTPTLTAALSFISALDPGQLT